MDALGALCSPRRRDLDHGNPVSHLSFPAGLFCGVDANPIRGDPRSRWPRKSSVKPEPAALSTSEPGVISLAAVTAEGPYRKPTRLDLDRLLGLVAAKLSAAEDHIWALRKDPGYFAEVALDMKEHRLEQMVDINGQKHSYLKTPPFRKFWDRVLGLLIIDAYLAVAYWDDMHSQIQHLRELLNKHAANIK